MGLILEDGKGKGTSAGVSTDGRLDVNAKTNSRATYISKDNGQAYSWSCAYDYSAADTILMVTNTSTTKNLYIESIFIGTDTATRFTVHSPVFPTLAGTPVTGVNDNRNSGNVAEALAYQNETGNSQANVLHQGMLAASTTFHIDSNGRLILGYRASVAVDLVTAGTMATCTIIGYFE